MLSIPKSLAKKLAQFEELYPEIINVYFLNKIKLAVAKKQRIAKFYEISGTSYTGGIEFDGFIPTLEHLKYTFIKLELYEKAQECEDLINKIQIEKLISESQK